MVKIDVATCFLSFSFLPFHFPPFSLLREFLFCFIFNFFYFYFCEEDEGEVGGREGGDDTLVLSLYSALAGVNCSLRLKINK